MTDWEDKWLVGRDEHGTFHVQRVLARHLPEHKVWNCNLRPGCRSPVIQSVPEPLVYATEAIARARADELGRAGAP